MKLLVQFALLAAVGCAWSATAKADWFDEPRLPTQVNAHIWRSSRPTQATLANLYQHGVRVIIDLEDDQDAIQLEEAMAVKMGFTFYSYPTDGFWSPEDARMNEILGLLRTVNAPILVHCLHGEDRTGLVIGLERVFLEKWPVINAYDEMLTNGFHPLLLGLDEYFRAKTGMGL